ncbi:MAG: DUF4287 domain-containing protein [Asticcacaulis sp.]
MSPNLTERQRKWFASVEASLERDTGRTLEEWVAIARACPETKPRDRVKWLKLHYDLGQNRAAHVLGAAFPDTMGWDDPDALRAALWRDPAAAAILAAIESAVDFPDTLLTQRKGYTAWSRAVQFAALKPVKSGASLGLAIAPESDPVLLPAGKESWSERLKARITLSSPDDVPPQVKGWLRAAWERS